jgi:hypothetical protein
MIFPKVSRRIVLFFCPASVRPPKSGTWIQQTANPLLDLSAAAEKGEGL